MPDGARSRVSYESAHCWRAISTLRLMPQI
jgi:hypothetical protein